MMKNLLFLLALFAPVAARAQLYGLYQTCELQTAMGQAVPGAQVYFLTQPANTSTLTPLATVYSNSAGTGGPVTQPLTTNGFGECSAYLAQGVYTVVYISQYTGQLNYVDQNVVIGGQTPTGALLTSPSASQGPTQPSGTNFSVVTSGGGKELYNGNEVLTTVTGCTISECLTPSVQLTPSGPQSIQQPTGTTLTANVLNNVSYIVPGSELGAQINAAIAATPSTQITIVIPPTSTPYTWSTLVTIDPRIVSIVGSGSANTVINCTAAECLKLFEPTFTLTEGGQIAGFTLNGSGAAGQIGIESAGVQGERWDDLNFEGFTGTGAISWYLNNSNTSNGWQERVTATKIRVQNGTGLKFNYNTSNTAASSFGYSAFEVTCDDATTPCFWANNGRLYASDIRIQGNISPGGTMVQVDSTGDLDENRYYISAELIGSGSGNCIDNAGKMAGTGNIYCTGGAVITNTASVGFAANMRVITSDSGFYGSSPFGTFTNFWGSSNTGTASIISTNNSNNPYDNFGAINGPFIDSTYTSFQNTSLGTNGFIVYACPPGGTALSGCTAMGSVSQNGIITALSGFAVGAPTGTPTPGVTCSGTPSSSFATVNGIITHC
jgi:hypothetical protein